MVRHADVTPGGGSDPSLNPAGQARAAALAHAVRSAGVSTIFVTSLQRSQQTAEPTATALGLALTTEDDVPTVIASINALPSSRVVLVVGHTDTIPTIASGFGVTVPPIPSTEFDNFYVVSRRRLTRLRYGTGP